MFPSEYQKITAVEVLLRSRFFALSRKLPGSLYVSFLDDPKHYFFNQQGRREADAG
jgi:hypothetical protein